MGTEAGESSGRLAAGGRREEESWNDLGSVSKAGLETRRAGCIQARGEEWGGI